MIIDVLDINADSSQEQIEKALNELLNYCPCTVSEYIVVQYNKCLLYQWSKRDADFLIALSELNRLTRSRLIDDSKAGELLYYNIAQFNYQTHNYEYARDNLEKSKKQEFLEELKKDNVELRFRKRLLLCFCKEYIAIDTKNGMVRNSIFCDTVSSLFGIELNKRLNEESEREYVGKNLILLAEASDDSIESIVNLLNDKGPADENVDSVLHFINTAKEKELIDNTTYETWLFQIVHILAHCLSERFEKDQINSQKSVYYKRLAEILMKKLGNEYAACYATIKMENQEYSSALNYLEDVKSKKIEKCKLDNKSIEENASIAELNFYCWYFSVCADLCLNGQPYKEAFCNYCMKTSDPIANIYYHILNMKENLVRGFEELSRMKTNTETREKVKQAFLGFEKNEPRYIIHKEITKEWDFLKKSYQIYLICYDISDRSKNNQDYQIGIYKLSLLLLSNSNVEKAQLKARPNHIGQAPIFYIVTTSIGKFIYKGSGSKLINLCSDLDIQITSIPFAKMDELNNKLSIASLKNVSNILILTNDSYVNEDIDFVNRVVAFDQGKTINDKHNIYIDVSQLSENRKRDIDSIYNDVCYDQGSVDLISNTKTSIVMCVLFSAMEEHLHKLKKKMDSHVISPVAQDDAFDDQYCNKLLPMSFRDIGLKIGSLPNWKNNFVSCYSKDELTKFKGVFLNLKKLRESLNIDYSKIDYLFYFKSRRTDNNKIDSLAFKINESYDLNCNYILGDIITIQDQCTQADKRYGISDFMLALKRLYDRNESYNNHDGCERKDCFSKFSFADIENNASYRSLREYLYSYVGVLLNKKTFLLIQKDEGGFRAGDSATSYLICSFKKEEERIDENTQINICHALRNTYYIEYELSELDNKDYISIRPKDDMTILDELKAQLRRSSINPSCSKYIFISYRSRNGTPRLCIPVYQDVIYLQNEYKDIKWVIDIQSFDTRFDDNIRSYINNENCIGSFLYLSEEYLSGGDDDSDKCLLELRLLAEKKMANRSFFVIPILLKDSNKCTIGPEQLITPIKQRLLDKKGTNGDRIRNNALNCIFGITTNDEIDINSYMLYWEFNQKHLEKLVKDGNFSVELRKNGINIEG